MTNAPTVGCSVLAFIFDVDGVIADTARLHAEAWRRLAEEEGLAFDQTMADALRGLSREASLRLLLGEREVPAERFAEMMARKNGYYVASVEGLGRADALPGAVELIEELAATGMKLAAASASRNARDVLQRVRMLDRFDAVVDGNEVTRPKPDPELFLKAVGRLRVIPRKCVVVEDAASGIAAARGAGMRTVGLGDEGRLCAATIVLRSLAGMTAAELIQRLGG